MNNLLSALPMLVVVIFLGLTPSAADTSSGTESRRMAIKLNQEEIHCLALNIYFESRNSNLADKAAVADVVLNRVHDARYPGTICDVVQQGKLFSNNKPKKNQCQFSWYCDGISDKPKNNDAWYESQLIAYQMVNNGTFRGISEGATHYHAKYVNPAWAGELQLVGRIGEHIFYRWQ